MRSIYGPIRTLFFPTRTAPRTRAAAAARQPAAAPVCRAAQSSCRRRCGVDRRCLADFQKTPGHMGADGVYHASDYVRRIVCPRRQHGCQPVADILHRRLYAFLRRAGRRRRTGSRLPFFRLQIQIQRTGHPGPALCRGNPIHCAHRRYPARRLCRLQFRQRLPSRCGRQCFCRRLLNGYIAVFNHAAVYHSRPDDYCLLSRPGRPARRAAV